jgi:hypothetical protein
MERTYHLRVYQGRLLRRPFKIPQAITQGKTMDECLKNAREAIELALEYVNVKQPKQTPPKRAFT